MTETVAEARVALSKLALDTLPRGQVRALAEDARNRVGSDLNAVVAAASELLENSPDVLPAWVDSETRFLVVSDVAPQSVIRLPAALRLHKPHLRLHVSPDAGVVKRFVLAQERERPWEGIVDAYTLGSTLVVVHGDLTFREYPQARLPRIHRLDPGDFAGFEIDSSGSFLHWPSIGVHLGASQMLQAVDPMYLADVQIERYARQKVSLVVLDMREERGLRQTEIPGLSDRHVRRLENEEANLTVDAAKAYAAAFGMGISEFLMELGERLGTFDEVGTERRTKAPNPGGTVEDDDTHRDSEIVR